MRRAGFQVPWRGLLRTGPGADDKDTHRATLAPTMPSSADQRRAPRIPVDLPVRYRSGNVSLDGRAGDLSQDGCFFLTPFLDDVAGEVEIEIDLPDADAPVTVGGEVRWIDDRPLHAGMGIRFTHVPLRERLLLANYVLQRTHLA